MKIALLCLVFVLAVYEAHGKCNCNCPRNEPVCAKDPTTGEQQTFPSPCALACYNCSFNKHFVPIKKGDC